MNDLVGVLDRVRDAVLGGNFSGLGSLNNDVTALLNEMGRIPAKDATDIVDKARRNALLLSAALQGMRAARRRLSDLREAASGHRTYGPGGQRSAVTDAPSVLRQRV